ncbi:MAG TPA: SurA N-terminal domain-containing protein [Myxococcales bacterium]|nr:SurA N-terminal domain-containing protein [Myxococcales bacterium]
MLDVMRSNAKSSLVALIFGAIIISFMFQFGPGTSGCRARASETWAARVNGETVTATEFSQAYQGAFRDQRERRGGKYTEEQARQDNLGKEALKGLVDQQLIAQQARVLGIVVSDKELGDQLAKDPQFQKGGKFDWGLYKARVENSYRVSIQRFEDDMRRRMLLSRVTEALLAGASVSDDEVKAYYVAQHEQAAITYVKFNAFMFRGEARATDAEAETYAKSHAKEIEDAYNRDLKTRWTQGAGVKVRAVTVSIPPGSSPEQEAAAKARVEAAYAEVKGGKDFAAVAKEKSDDSTTRLSGGDLGFVSRGGSAYGKALEEEALKLAPGQISSVFKDRVGFHFLKAEETRPEHVQPLAEVQKQIALDLLKNQKAKDLAQKKAAEALAQVKAGKDLKGLFPSKKSESGQFDFASFTTPQAQDTEKLQIGGGYIPGVGAAPKLTAAVFSLSEAGATPAAPIEDGETFYVFKVKERERADLSKLDAAARQKAEDELVRRKQMDMYTSLLARLRNSARIVENDRLLATEMSGQRESSNPEDG